MTKARLGAVLVWSLAIVLLTALSQLASVLGPWLTLGGFVLLWFGAAIGSGLLFERWATPEERAARAEKRRRRDERIARPVRERAAADTGKTPPDTPSK
jgi:predicted tellurium resistance membrane protein TerC